MTRPLLSHPPFAFLLSSRVRRARGRDPDRAHRAHARADHVATEFSGAAFIPNQLGAFESRLAAALLEE